MHSPFVNPDVYRRSLLFAVTAALAGCGASERDRSRTVNPQLRGSPPPTTTPAESPAPYGTGRADRLDRPRSVVVENREVRPEWLSLEIDGEGTRATTTTVRVPAAGRTRIDGVFESPGVYDIRVRTTDRRQGRFEWAPGPGGDDLGIDLDGGVSVRDVYPAAVAGEFVQGTTGLLAAGSATADGTLVVETRTSGGSVRIVVRAAADGEDSDRDTADGNGTETPIDTLALRVPSGSRVSVPLSVPRDRVSVRAETGTGVDSREWRPDEDEAVYCLLDGRPRFVCDLLIRDVVVENGTAADAAVDLSIQADDAIPLDSTVYPVAGGAVRVQSAVPPAGTYALTVSHGRESVRKTLSACPAAGPLVVRLSERTVNFTSRAVGGAPESTGAEETATDPTAAPTSTPESSSRIDFL
jgi:hypothetical protein